MTKCKLCDSPNANITVRDAKGNPLDVCKPCLEESRQTSNPLSVAVVWKPTEPTEGGDK